MQILQFVARMAAAALLAGMVSPVFAEDYHPEYRGTYEQQMACTGDVFRLCGREIPDERRITGCLRNNVASLSRGCRAVFEPTTGSVQPSPPRQDQRNVYPRDRNTFDNDNWPRSPSYENRRNWDDDN